MTEGKLNIYEMKASEIRDLRKLFELADEAAEAATIIKQRYSSAFGIGCTEIDVYSVDNFGEYYGNASLSINGIWKYSDNWGGHNEWKLDCSSEETIYRFFVEAYLKEKVSEHDDFLTPVRYFRRFIEQEKKKMEKND